MMSMLFSSIDVGRMALSQRVVMAPLTRSRSEQPGDVPEDLMREYYAQRASSGGLVISEATTISVSARGWLGAPGLYSDQQVDG
jgi:N-ethylmaleimide reductase